MKLMKLLIILGIFLIKIEAKPCKYWCKTDNDAFYCCPDGKSEKLMKESWNNWSTWPFGIVLLNIFGFHMGLPTFSHQEEYSPEIYKHCPPPRSACPRVYDWDFDPPKYCNNHDDCYHSDEACCYDVCIDHHVCKPSL